MDKLENAIYVIVRKYLTKDNYENYNEIISKYKEIYNIENIKDIYDENNIIRNNINNIINDIKTLYNSIGINIFNENIILDPNELLDNVINTSYKINRITSNTLYESNEVIEPILKYKLLYLINNSDIDFTKNIKIDNDLNIDLNNIKNDDILKISNTLNSLIKEKNIHIKNILKIIFDINPESFNKLVQNDDFAELSIPAKIITFLDSTDNNDNIQLNMYKLIYNTLISYLKNPKNISKIDFLKYISNNIKTFNIDEITTSINDIDIIDEVKNITFTDNNKLFELNIDDINDVNKFEEYNNEIYTNITKILSFENYTDKINNILNKDITIYLKEDNLNFTLTFKDVLTGFNTFNGSYWLKINSKDFLDDKDFKSLVGNEINDLKFAPNSNISNLGAGLFMNINKKLNKYLNENINDITNILGEEVLSKLFGKKNIDRENIDKKHIDDYCSIVFKNIINKTEAFNEFYDIFNNYNTEDTKFVKLYYCLAYQNKKEK